MGASYNKLATRAWLAYSVYCVCRNLQRPDVLKYVGTYFKAPRMILAAAGGLQDYLILYQISKHFIHLLVKYRDADVNDYASDEINC